GDVSNFDEAKAIIDKVIDRFDRVDVLINNAGITRDGLIMRMKEVDFDDVVNTNLKGAFNMCRHVTQPMLKQRAGTIINMSSVVGMIGNDVQTNYADIKNDLLGLTISLVHEFYMRHIICYEIY